MADATGLYSTANCVFNIPVIKLMVFLRTFCIINLLTKKTTQEKPTTGRFHQSASKLPLRFQSFPSSGSARRIYSLKRCDTSTSFPFVRIHLSCSTQNYDKSIFVGPNFRPSQRNGHQIDLARSSSTSTSLRRVLKSITLWTTCLPKLI